MINRVICLVIGYAFGCLLAAPIASKLLNNANIFQLGSKNPGMANVACEVGGKAALATFIGDAVKVIIATLICRTLFPAADLTILALWVGLGATLGHNFPFWHKFKGGMGVMTTCTAFILANPLLGIISLALGGAATIFTQYLGVGAVVICLAYVVGCLILGQAEAAYISLLLTILMFYAHREQLRQIPFGTAEKFDVIQAIKPAFTSRKTKRRHGGMAARTNAPGTRPRQNSAKRSGR